MKWIGYWKDQKQVDTMSWYPPHLVVGCKVDLEGEQTVVELKLAAKQQVQTSPPAHNHDR